MVFCIVPRPQSLSSLHCAECWSPWPVELPVCKIMSLLLSSVSQFKEKHPGWRGNSWNCRGCSVFLLSRRNITHNNSWLFSLHLVLPAVKLHSLPWHLTSKPFLQPHLVCFFTFFLQELVISNINYDLRSVL